MFQLEKINDLFECKICKDLLVDPIILPCGETVCNVHTEKISEDNCLLCTEMHISPKSGFPSNKIVKNQLDLEINKTKLDFTQFNEYHVILRELNRNLKEIDALRKNPEDYISEYFAILTRQINLRRETLIEDIHNYSDELILKIEKLKQECVGKSKETSGITNDLDTIKAKMNELNSMFNSSEIDEIKFKEIMTKKKAKELRDLMRPFLKQYKFELQREKYYKVLTNEINLEDVFGSLSCSDFDPDLMKVNIV